MSNKRVRQIVRALHIAYGILLGLIVYGLLEDGSVLDLAIKYFFYPALIGSGLVMWQQPRVMKFFRRNK